jgi:hypothetical protein
MNVKRLVVSGLLVVGLIFLAGVATADDGKPIKHVVAHTILAGKDISRTTATINDGPDHEIAQRVYSYVIHSDDKDFDNMWTENFAHTDTTGGNGTHSGYAIWKNDRGDKIYMQFRGEHHAKSGSADNAKFSGAFSVRGGTGKFSGISGKGSYKGEITPSGQSSEVTLDASY